MPRTVEELEQLVRILSVGYPGYDPANVRASADATAEILRDAGLGDVRPIELEGGHPAVFGELAGPAGSPTLLLYAHHDVQPAADPEAWTTPPRAGGPRRQARRARQRRRQVRHRGGCGAWTCRTMDAATSAP